MQSEKEGSNVSQRLEQALDVLTDYRCAAVAQGFAIAALFAELAGRDKKAAAAAATLLRQSATAAMRPAVAREIETLAAQWDAYLRAVPEPPHR